MNSSTTAPGRNRGPSGSRGSKGFGSTGPRVLSPSFAWAELNRAFVGAELVEEFAELAARRIDATRRGSLLREISEQFWANP